MDYSQKIKELNQALMNPRESYEVLTGFETILENLVSRIYDLFGRNALLSMLYTIGSGPGHELANTILEEKRAQKIEDPFEAMKLLLTKSKEFFSVQVQNYKLESYDEKYEKLIMTINNSCFYRESLNRKKLLKIGGPLCRINKAFFETAWKTLTGLRCEIDFKENDDANGHCNETITIYLPIGKTH